MSEFRWEKWEGHPDHYVLRESGEGFDKWAAWVHDGRYVVDGKPRSEKPGYVVELYMLGAGDIDWEVVSDGIEDLATAKAVAVACWRMK